MSRLSEGRPMQDCKELDILSVTTTVSSVEDAKALAREILAQRLAACVQIEQGLVSLYRWQGQLCEEPEVRLVIKSLPGCEPALQALFAGHHPYEVPQFLATRMSASAGYAQWARAETAAPPG
jgi:periplasmic divalent cation tolerance protein